MYCHVRPGAYSGVPTRSLETVCLNIGLYLARTRDEGTGVGGRVTIRDRIAAIRAHCADLCASTTVGSWNFFGADRRFLRESLQRRDSTVIRAYQAAAVDEFVDMATGIAQSGALWMPCGAGKTLTALLVVERLQTHALIFVNTTLSGAQWKSQIQLFFHVEESDVLLVDSPDSFTVNRLVSDRPAIVIMTYAFATTDAHSVDTSSALALMMALSYGILILDEAQTAVATDFRRAISVSACMRLAISATFARCDNKLDILPAYIGDKVVTVPLEHLLSLRMVARVELTDVEVIGEPQVNSPTRVAVATNIIETHQRSGDRVIVFFDEISLLETMHTMMTHVIGDSILTPLMGDTACTFRRSILARFREATSGIVLFMTTVGDTAVDLPDANVLLQFGCGSASHNQELQRIGRIQRIGKYPSASHIAYTLWNRQTGEMQRLHERRLRTAADGYACTAIVSAAGTVADPFVHLTLANRVSQPAPVISFRVPAQKSIVRSSMSRRLAIAIRKKV